MQDFSSLTRTRTSAPCSGSSLYDWCACQSCLTICDPMTVAHQPPLSMRFPGQEYWSGLAFPYPGHLPNPGVEAEALASPGLVGRFLTTEPAGKP